MPVAEEQWESSAGREDSAEIDGDIGWGDAESGAFLFTLLMMGGNIYNRIRDIFVIVRRTSA
jgi:hypothetical protein